MELLLFGSAISVAIVTHNNIFFLALFDRRNLLFYDVYMTPKLIVHLVFTHPSEEFFCFDGNELR